MQTILIIDDDTYICKLLENYLSRNGFATESAYSAKTAHKKIDEGNYDLVISDYRLPDSDGYKLLERIRARDTRIPVIIMTAYKDLPTAVKLIKAGAWDYITKPLIPEEVAGLINEAISSTTQTSTDISFEKDFIVGKSKGFNEIIEHVSIVAPVNMTVVIEGETGSGKEFIARAIHHNSSRKEKPFIAVDCGAMTKGLANSELFGHIKGAFTGATFDKQGVFEQAQGGTLFLDEISNLDAENQVKLLRVLQEKTITRVGDASPVKVDVRLVVALNQDLVEEVKRQKIREDLYHRLNEFKIRIPPLRDREEDILVFAEAFMQRAAIRFNKEVSNFEPDVLDIFRNYSWPGNIRELKNVVNRAVLLTKSAIIRMDGLPLEIKTNHAISQNTLSAGNDHAKVDLKEASDQAEKDAVIKALIHANYNKSEAARLLKIDRKTLYNKIKQFNISIKGI